MSADQEWLCPAVWMMLEPHNGSMADARVGKATDSAAWTSVLSPLLSSLLADDSPQLASAAQLSAPTPRTFSDAVHKDKRPPSPLSLSGRIAAKRTKTRTRTRARRLLLLCIVSLAFASVINNFFHSITSVWSKRRRRHRAVRAATGTAAQEYVRTGRHPIRAHLERAHATWNAAVSHQSQTVAEAEFEYRKRYGRDPPMGFSEWFAFAKEHDYELPDEYDGMMDSLEPFWALQPSDLRRRTVEVAVLPSFSLVRRTEEGTAIAVSSPEWDASAPQGRNMAALLSKIGARSGLTPFAMALDEIGRPRVLPTWEESERLTDILRNGPNVTQKALLTRLDWPDPLWDGDGGVWTDYARTCAPHSAARRALSALGVGMQATSMTESGRVEWLASRGIQAPGRRRLGPRRRQQHLPRVASPASSLFEALDSISFDFPIAPGFDDAHAELCGNRTLHDQHNLFFSDYRTINQYYPIFSTAKIDGFADILVPTLPFAHDAGGLLKHRAKQSNFGRWMPADTETPWEARDNRMFWRGEPSGESQTPPGYELNFARPRLVRKTSSTVFGTEDVVAHAREGYRQLAVVRSKRKSLNARTTNVAFTGLRGCGSVRACATLEGGEVYSFAPLERADAGMRRSKAVIDVDGEGDSTSRFLLIVDSGAAALRGTIMRDALSDQIMPWVHYIPMSPDFRELYHLHAYFLGSTVDANAKGAISQTREQNVPRHEGTLALRRVAQNGRRWRKMHTRPVDAEIYVYRLALEWSRLWTRSDEEFWAQV